MIMITITIALFEIMIMVTVKQKNVIDYHQSTIAFLVSVNMTQTTAEQHGSVITSSSVRASSLIDS